MKISVVTSSFNSEKTIAAALRSVRSQSHADVEHIVIDGASTDLTRDIVAREGRAGLRIISEPDTGIYDAWNKGIRSATGEYILILNSDDKLFDAEVLADCARFAEKFGKPKVIHGKLRAFEESSGYSYIDGRPTTLDRFLFRMDFCTLAALFRRDVFTEIGLFDQSYQIASDYDWAIRAFKSLAPGEIVFFDRVMTDFSVGGVSNRRYRKAYAEVSEIVRKHFPPRKFVLHKAYVTGLMALKAVLPAARATGLLWAWRKLRPAR